MPRRSDPYQERFPTKDGWRCRARPSFVVAHINCCGIKELHGVQDHYLFYNRKADRFESVQPAPNIQMAQIKDALAQVHPHRPIYIFSDADRRESPGEKLAQYIEKHKLGSVTRSGYHLNPNSGNDIQMYTWIIDNKAVRKHKPAV